MSSIDAVSSAREARRDDGVEETLGRDPDCTHAERDFDAVEQCHDERVIDDEHVELGDRHPD